MEKLTPSTDFETVQRLLEETDEGLAILRVRGNVPMGGITDIRPHARRAQIGGVLSAAELMETSSTIRAGRIFRHFIEAVIQDEELDIPHFLAIKNDMPIATGLEHEINSAIDENGRVLDSASTSLRTVRQSLRIQEGRVREKLESFTRGKNAATMLSDSIVTIRNDRLVIPVKSE